MNSYFISLEICSLDSEIAANFSMLCYIFTGMENIFTLPRSGESHPDNKNLVGSYILQKFIRQGLMTAEQTFRHEIKLNALARMKQLPRVVMFSTLLLTIDHSGKSLFPNICSLPLLLFFWLKWAGYLAVAGLNLLAQISDRRSPYGV